MASQPEYSKLLFAKALDDYAVLNILIEKKEAADEIIGFHAQQVVEKLLKAVLSFRNIEYRKTHDIAELIDIVKDNGIKIPESMEDTIDLTPYAVEFRYDFLPPEVKKTERMGRQKIMSLVDIALDWVKKIIN
jgi:HEPN domain-containing protein